MKNYLLLMLFNFLFFNINAQELVSDSTVTNPKLLLGNWGFDYADYQDGTLVRDNNVIRSAATMLSFRRGNAITSMFHARAINLTYSVKNDKLTVGAFSYRIEKLNNNELIFTLWEDVARESYQVLRFHYLATKESSEEYYFRNFVKPNITIKPNGDTTYAFTEDFFPQFFVKTYRNEEYELNNFNDVFQASYQVIEKAFNFSTIIKGRFRVQFDVTKTGQIADIVVKETSDSAYNNQLIKAVASTSKFWKNAEYRNIPVAVQFNYIFEYDGKEEENSYYDYEFYQSLMQRANNHFVKQNYEKAVKLYTKCILMTDNAIDALYKRADCYFTVNALKNACSDWNYLAGKGQKRAERLYLRNCMK